MTWAQKPSSLDLAKSTTDLHMVIQAAMASCQPQGHHFRKMHGMPDDQKTRSAEPVGHTSLPHANRGVSPCPCPRPQPQHDLQGAAGFQPACASPWPACILLFCTPLSTLLIICVTHPRSYMIKGSNEHDRNFHDNCSGGNSFAWPRVMCLEPSSCSRHCA